MQHNSSNNKKIFISHSSKDKDVVESFVNNILRLGCGLNQDDIACTSIESMGVHTGKDIRDYIKTYITNCDYVFFMISENYKNSGICLNEMGAAWILNKKVKPFLFPNLNCESLGWLYEISKGANLNDTSALGSLHDELLDNYGLIKHSTADWEKQIRIFISKLEQISQNMSNPGLEKQFSDAEKEILENLASSEDNVLRIFTFDIGKTRCKIIGTKCEIEMETPRQEAAFKDFIEWLSKNNLISLKHESRGNKSYELTTKGYKYVESL